MKKIIVGLLIIIMCMNGIVVTGEEMAENITENVTENTTENTEENTTTIQGELTSKAAVLMEPDSGTIIVDKNGDERLSPASITKIMTLLLIFDEIQNGNIKLEDMVTTSAYAKSMGGSQVFLEQGEQQTVDTLIKCIVIASGNDASVAMAEYISGSETEFVDKMNERAKGLGMENTHFEDCCGLTDSDNHYSSAKDVAIMSAELITKYPQILEYSSIWMETIIHKTDKGEKEFVLSNTNKLLKTNDCIKGLKTGSTSKAKYCVSIVGEKDGVSMISVIMAAPDFKTRFAEAEKLINYGFSKCKVYKDESNHDYDIDIQNGKEKTVNIVAKNQFTFVEAKGRDIGKIRCEEQYNKKIKAPVKKGDVLGKCVYYYDEEKIGEIDLIANENITKTSFLYEYLEMLKNVFRCVKSA